MIGVELGAAQREPVLGGGAGEEVLGQVGAIDRRLFADQRDGVGVAEAAQRLGGSGPGGAGTDDHYRLRVGRRLAIGDRRLDRSLDGDLAVALGGAVHRNRVEGGRPHRLPGGDIEHGVVPGTVQPLAVAQAFAQRPAVVGAAAADGADTVGCPYHHYRLAVEMAHERHVAADGLGGDGLGGEIGAGKFDSSCHGDLLRLLSRPVSLVNTGPDRHRFATVPE